MTDPGYLTLVGHEDIRRRLARAVEGDRLPQSLLLHGPRGVGKQRLALWTAAALNCQGTPRPCGECHGCRLSDRLVHPDIHWFFPLPRPKRATGAEQLQQKLENARASALEERRANPLYRDDEEGATGIYVAAVHVMRRLAQKAPAMGPHKVLVIGRADMLTPQLASPEAANALLKLLEEPPADTTLILTTDVPGALLPTIRSRVQAVRIAPLPTQQVAAFLRDALGRSPNESRQLAARSEGAIGRALELGEAEGDDLREAAREIVRATLARRLEPGLSAAHRFRPFGARGGFLRALSEARALLRDLLAAAAGAAPAAPETAALAGEAPCLDDIIAALEALEAARELAERNVNPQLIVANLGRLGPGAAVRTPEPNSR